jgi:hypothetical protein
VYPNVSSVAAIPGLGDHPELPPLLVWGVLVGAGFLTLFGTGLLAWRLDRRARNAARAAAGAPAARARHHGAPARVEAARDFAALRAAALRAASAAAVARERHTRAARALESAERAYRAASPPVSGIPTSPAVPPTTGVPAQAGVGGVPAQASIAAQAGHPALGAYRRGDLTADDLRRVWFESSGWNLHATGTTPEEAEPAVLRQRADALAAHREYQRALAAAHAARRAVYVADTAARALAAEAAAAAAELAGRPAGRRRG